jgi:hypothetical protein
MSEQIGQLQQLLEAQQEIADAPSQVQTSDECVLSCRAVFWAFYYISRVLRGVLYV